jgi:L-lactate dehydrogenase (cytochrome)
MLDAGEIAKHNNAASCWIIIDSLVYDVTEFLGDHPGGASIILRYAGQVGKLPGF